MSPKIKMRKNSKYHQRHYERQHYEWPHFEWRHCWCTQKKSHVRKELNLLTNADISKNFKTDMNEQQGSIEHFRVQIIFFGLERLLDFQKKIYLVLFCFFLFFLSTYFVFGLKTFSAEDIYIFILGLQQPGCILCQKWS